MIGRVFLIDLAIPTLVETLSWQAKDASVVRWLVVIVHVISKSYIIFMIGSLGTSCACCWSTALAKTFVPTQFQLAD